jgi:hypothetical protein
VSVFQGKIADQVFSRAGHGFEVISETAYSQSRRRMRVLVNAIAVKVLSQDELFRPPR